MKMKPVLMVLCSCLVSAATVWAAVVEHAKVAEDGAVVAVAVDDGLSDGEDRPMTETSELGPVAVDDALPTLPLSLKSFMNPGSAFCPPSYSPDCYYECHGGTCVNGQKCARKCYAPSGQCEPELLCVDACLD